MTSIETLVQGADTIRTDADEVSISGAIVVDDLFKALEKNGWERCDVFETNGWDWDWWESFTKDNIKITVSGSGFYGGCGITLAYD